MHGLIKAIQWLVPPAEPLVIVGDLDAALTWATDVVIAAGQRGRLSVRPEAR
jgi:hypothetical protein